MNHPTSETHDQHPDPRVEVRRNSALAAATGAAASALAIGYLGRATGSGALLDWLLCAALAAVGAVHLLALLDCRAPLLVADQHGVRLRLGRTWQGVPWRDLARVQVRPRRGLLRDGVLALHPLDEAPLLAGLDPAARRKVRWARRLRGASWSVPLSVATRAVGAGPDLAATLARLAGGATEVEAGAVGAGSACLEADAAEAEVVPAHLDADAAEMQAEEPLAETDEVLLDAADEEPAPRRVPDPRPVLARGIGAVAARLPGRRVTAAVREPGLGAPTRAVAAEAAPAPLRQPVSGARAELLADGLAAEAVIGATALRLDPQHDETTRELRRPGSVSLVEDTLAWGDRVAPIARPGAPVEPLVIDDLAAEPAEDPVIGPELAAARTRLGLSVDQLAERTRIRPHVIESLEVDDFAPCGGDFYARGHLRTLARVLGLDAGPLLAAYGERYADAEISPRRVFEAELATGPQGPIRGLRGGPNWSVLVAAVMAVVLVWSVARLVMDGPVDVDRAPALNGSPGLGLSNSGQRLADPVPVVLTAAGGGARVVVRDAGGQVVFSGDLAFGESRQLEVSPPVRVQSSDGSLVVTVAGEERGALGATGEPAQNTFPAP